MEASNPGPHGVSPAAGGVGGTGCREVRAGHEGPVVSRHGVTFSRVFSRRVNRPRSQRERRKSGEGSEGAAEVGSWPGGQ